MEPRMINKLIAEHHKLGEKIKALQERRREIADQFPIGRTEGDKMDFMRTDEKRVSRIDMYMLRRYVTQTVLDSCRIFSRHRGSGKVVPKLKGRKKAQGHGL